jgi:NADPH-dependent 2,4-dienoyl-CoA reductase/sulfur reductase-like enzyme
MLSRYAKAFFNRLLTPPARLLLAMGSRPRRLNLPGETDAPVFYLRDIADALALRERLASGRRLIVIGGGLIGLEVAAAAVAHGCAVTVIEVADRLMARVVGPEISAHFAQLHQARGTEILTGRIPERIEASEDRCRVVCRDGGSCGGDLAVIGCGVIPNAELAAAAGLKVENGLWVDEFCRTDDPNIWAAGDVTNHLNPVLGRRLRLETWQNAQNQAIAAARNMVGDPQPYAEIPWGWSDQLGSNLQVLGVPTSFHQAVTRGDPASGSFTVFYIDGEKIAGVNAVNAPKDIAVARRLMAGDMAYSVETVPRAIAHAASTSFDAATFENGGERSLDLLRFFGGQHARAPQANAMGNAGPDVDFEQPPVKTETAIELGKARIRLARKSSAPKILVRCFAHQQVT